jgi:hypothetical protein
MRTNIRQIGLLAAMAIFLVAYPLGHPGSPWHNQQTWRGGHPTTGWHGESFHHDSFRFAHGYRLGGFYDPYFYDPYFYGFPFYAGFYSYFPYGYPFYWDYSSAVDRAGLRELAVADMAEFNVQVKPKDAYVYVDGQLAGTAGQFDGSPGYLWLKAGTHRLAIYKDGYQTIDESIQAQPGTRIKIKEKMQPGKAVLPEGLSNPSSEPGEVKNG